MPAGGTEQLPVDMIRLVDEDIHMEDAVEGQVGHQHTEADGQQQQRLKLLDDGQIQQHAGDAQHDEAAPVAVLGKEVEAGVL